MGPEREPKLEPSKALFSLGHVVGTPGALEALAQAQQEPLEFLARHVTGEWGQLDDEDKAQNDFSVKNGLRILSAYTLQTGVKIWIISEADRSSTTILLPSEY
jgi:hypothetical protein